METASYAALRSPRNAGGGGGDDAFARLAADTASAVARFHQSTRAIMQKMLVLGTAQDSPASRDALHALTHDGNALVGHVQRSLQELDALCDAPGGGPESPRRRRRAQVDALASDFRSQCWNFEDTCRRLIDAERAAIAHIRQHAGRRDRAADRDASAASATALDLANFGEDKRGRAESFDSQSESDGSQSESDRSQSDRSQSDRDSHARRDRRSSSSALRTSRSFSLRHAQEEPIREPSELVAQQRDVVVDVAVKDAEQTPERAASDGDARPRCCGCSSSLFVFLVVLAVIAVVLALVLGLQ